jgi:hypothetical protein
MPTINDAIDPASRSILIIIVMSLASDLCSIFVIVVFVILGVNADEAVHSVFGPLSE